MNISAKHGLALTLLIGVILVFAVQVQGDPTGASISGNITGTGPSSTAGSQVTARSTITTMVLDGTQQDQFWKAYVGNVTGGLSLDDATSNTIYDWTLASVIGEVYATRTNSPDWSTVTCVAGATMTSENTFNNMTQGQVDSINGTFNATGHAGFTVGSSTIVADTCASQALFVSNARQVANSTADFQEIVLEDNGGNLVYSAIINDDTTGFDGRGYDFQIIVAESNIKASATTYYFYLELG